MLGLLDSICGLVRLLELAERLEPDRELVAAS